MTLPDDDRAVTPTTASSSFPDRQPPEPEIKPADIADINESDRDFEREFVKEFEAIAESLAALDARYRQIQRDRQQRDQLHAELQAITHVNRRSESRSGSGDRDQLAQIRDQLEQLELNLESSLFSWSGLREPVWFGLRYGSLGFILGWLLHACTQ
ncbi:MAG: DUF2203 domain-containing protein [Coleofasciculaceae cyanobacterium RL_1_1]|nr:DUF2203 domain-containing protein [Coleofasciculaceae cyanobacterium RL_1_1]